MPVLRADYVDEAASGDLWVTCDSVRDGGNGGEDSWAYIPTVYAALFFNNAVSSFLSAFFLLKILVAGF